MQYAHVEFCFTMYKFTICTNSQSVQIQVNLPSTGIVNLPMHKSYYILWLRCIIKLVFWQEKNDSTSQINFTTKLVNVFSIFNRARNFLLYNRKYLCFSQLLTAYAAVTLLSLVSTLLSLNWEKRLLSPGQPERYSSMAMRYFLVKTDMEN